MIHPATAFRIYVATQPVDFRKGMDSLAALVASEFDLDPFSGAIFIFRSKRRDRLKLLVWDGTGLILMTKRLEEGSFVWPAPHDGLVTLGRAQLEALIEGVDWPKIRARETKAPRFAA